MAVTLEETLANTEDALRAFGYRGEEDIRSFLLQPKYALYIRIPKHVTSYLDHFGVSYQAKELSGALGVFYVWLKTADDLLDEEDSSGDAMLTQLGQRPVSLEKADTLDAAFLTAAVAQSLSSPNNATRGLALEHLYHLYTATCAESGVTTAHELITTRKSVGRYTSLLSLDIMEPYLSSDTLDFRYFLVRVGEVGTLLDSALDYDRDIATNKIALPSSARRRLYFETAKEALGLLSSYPFLLPYYLRGCISIPLHIAKERRTE